MSDQQWAVASLNRAERLLTEAYAENVRLRAGFTQIKARYLEGVGRCENANQCAAAIVDIACKFVGAGLPEEVPAKPPYSFRLVGTVPPGMEFDEATGTLSGTPTGPGYFHLAVESKGIPVPE